MSDNDTLPQLLKLIKEVKCKHDIPVLIDLTNRVATLEAQNLIDRVAKLEATASGSSKFTTRTSGYVNWNATHDNLKTKQWILLTRFTSACGLLERNEHSIHEMKVDLKRAIDASNIQYVNEKTRFPQSQVYVNMADPAVRAELCYIMEIKPNTPGLLDRFMNVAKKNIDTRNSFEEKYKLIWVD